MYHHLQQEQKFLSWADQGVQYAAPRPPNMMKVKVMGLPTRLVKLKRQEMRWSQNPILGTKPKFQANCTTVTFTFGPAPIGKQPYDKISANTANSVPKTSKFQSGHWLVKKGPKHLILCVLYTFDIQCDLMQKNHPKHSNFENHWFCNNW